MRVLAVDNFDMSVPTAAFTATISTIPTSNWRLGTNEGSSQNQERNEDLHDFQSK